MAWIKFYKLQAAGNDFVVFRGAELKRGESEKTKFVKAIAHRNLGIGCDQVLEVTALEPTPAIQIWNQDGSQAEMCANGARAFALLAEEHKWISGNAVDLGISGRTFSLEKGTEDQGFALNLGQPKFLGVETLTVETSGEWSLIPVYLVETPNPHAVVFLGEGKQEWMPPQGLDSFDFRPWGSALEYHKRFPLRTNVEFVYRCAKSGSSWDLDAKVWERGAGATLSSGSGSVAVATAQWQRTGDASPTAIHMNGFTLKVRKKDDGQTLLSGPAALVAKGEFWWETP